MTIFDDILIGSLASRKSYKARYIENIMYRDLRAREEARCRTEREAKVQAKAALVAAKAAKIAARPLWLKKLCVWRNTAAVIFLNLFAFYMLVCGIIQATLKVPG